MFSKNNIYLTSIYILCFNISATELIKEEDTEEASEETQQLEEILNLIESDGFYANILKVIKTASENVGVKAAKVVAESKKEAAKVFGSDAATILAKAYIEAAKIKAESKKENAKTIAESVEKASEVFGSEAATILVESLGG